MKMSMSNERMDRGPIGTAHALSEEAERPSSPAAMERSVIAVRCSALFGINRLRFVASRDSIAFEGVDQLMPPFIQLSKVNSSWFET
jgi:hypothetical protein